jgi:hypothetical protein
MTRRNAPLNKGLWIKTQILAQQRFKGYPNAHTNQWAVQYYDTNGGNWKTITIHERLKAKQN